MLLYLFTVRYSTVLFYTILRFPGQSFTAVRTPIIETTTFIKTPHTNSFEKWYLIHIRNKDNLYNIYSGGGYLSTVHGTGTCHFLGVLFQTITELWVSFSQCFDISRNYGCPFQWIFHNFRNYGPDIYSICEIMALKSTRIHGIMGTDFLSKMARPRHIIGRVTPPPPENI